jgi:phospholipid/cholesterol/gamma-HCH transport system substrate-binding protein
VKAIRDHARDFVAIIFLLVLSIAVSSYILTNQRFHLPAWVPVVGKEFFELKAEFPSALAVTPGQGQTVVIAGVDIGEISSVELKDGRALITMDIEPEYAEIYEDATMLLRPKTGLKDMVLQLDPGDSRNRRLEEGDTIPVQNTQPTIDLDEILSVLDADTRDYLTLLVTGGGEGLRGQGRELSNTLRRVEPLNRDLARLNRALARRRDNIRRVIHNFQLLATELGDKGDDIAELVDSSNAVFASLARQEARLRESLRLLPGSLQETERALAAADPFADQLGSTLQQLRPAARQLAPTLRQTRPFLRRTTPVIRDEIRPFTRESLPTVRQLRPAARDLAGVMPELRRSLRVANVLLNMLAFNPPGQQEEGYLFWMSWANHLANSIFATQDAHGPIRRGLVVTSCSSLGALSAVSQVDPVVNTILSLSNLPVNNDVCPETTGTTGQPHASGRRDGEDGGASAGQGGERNAAPGRGEQEGGG